MMLTLEGLPLSGSLASKDVTSERQEGILPGILIVILLSLIRFTKSVNPTIPLNSQADSLSLPGHCMFSLG